jgi:hypothetical protein
MNDDLKYQRFLEWIGNFNFKKEQEYYKFKNLVEKYNEYLPEVEIEVFYPQYLFVEEKDTELFFLTKTKFYKITGSEEEARFDVLNLKDVKDYSFNAYTENGKENVALNIFFTSGQHLFFNNAVDTNDHWQNTFKIKIKQIINILNND